MGGKADPYRRARTRLSSAVRDMMRWIVGKDGDGVRGNRKSDSSGEEGVSRSSNVPGRQASQPVEGEER
jgi:hypothetical protein